MIQSEPLSAVERQRFLKSEIQQSLELIRVMETIVEACRMTITEDAPIGAGRETGQYPPAIRPIAKQHEKLAKDMFRFIKKHCPRLSLAIVEPYWVSPNVAVSALWTK